MTPGVITTDAMNELCNLMTSRELTAEVFDGWVSRYYAMPGDGGPGSVVEPRSVDSARLRVKAFDAYLMHPDVVDCRFIHAIIGLRNVFALYAGMSTPVTVIIGNPVPAVRKAPPKASPGFGDLLDLLLGPAGHAEPSF